MTAVQVRLNKELNDCVEIFQGEKRLSSKEKTILFLLEKYFNKNKGGMK